MNNRINIIIYGNPDHYPPTYNAVKILSKSYDVTIICRNVGHCGVGVKYPENVRVLRLGKYCEFDELVRKSRLENIKEFLIFVWKSCQFIRKKSNSLTFAYDAYGFVAGLIASKLGGKKPLLYQNHDLMEVDNALSLAKIVKAFELRFAKYADLIIFPESSRAKKFKSDAKLETDPILVRNAPLLMKESVKSKLADSLEALGFDRNEPVVFYQGAIGPSHAIEEIITSIEYWKKGVLVLIGYCSPTYKIRMLAVAKDNHVASRVCFLPMVPYTELFSYTSGATIGLALYQASDVNTGSFGGASNKIFEYLANGVPVIMSRTDSTQKILDNSKWGKLVDPDSPEEIAVAVNDWLVDSEAYSAACREAISAHRNCYNYENEFSPILNFIQSHTPKS